MHSTGALEADVISFLSVQVDPFVVELTIFVLQWHAYVSVVMELL